MTLEHIATFAESQDGRFYRDVCERFGVDPAASFTDEVLAHQFRVALALSHREAVPKPTVEDPYAAARDAAAKVKAMT